MGRTNEADAGREGNHEGTHPEISTMYHLLRTLPVCGTLGMIALLSGPLARLPIDVGAWLLDHLDRRLRA